MAVKEKLLVASIVLVFIIGTVKAQGAFLFGESTGPEKKPPQPIVATSAPVGIDLQHTSADTTGAKPANIPTTNIKPIVADPSDKPPQPPKTADISAGVPRIVPGNKPDVNGAKPQGSGLPDSRDKALIKRVCENSGCAFHDLCYEPHPLDCRKFIMCQYTTELGHYGTVMPCAFGTFWKTIEETCERADLINCPKDRCRGIVGNNTLLYDHEDHNCRTHWECKEGRSYAACCPRYHRFDAINNGCVKDVSCIDICPLINNETCQGRGVKSIDFPDNNCKTYWDCEKGKPHPLCCTDGLGYDYKTASCQKSSSCIDKCPDDYQNICERRGVQSYSVNDTKCRTFMKCVENGRDQAYCCRSGQGYDTTVGKCVDSTKLECLNEGCPEGFEEVCPFEAVPGENTKYYYVAAKIKMSCSVGTYFKGCACIKDTKTRKPSLTCVPALDFKPPNLTNQGDVFAAILTSGPIIPGTMYNSEISGFFGGHTSVYVPYYAGQAPWNVFLEVLLKPRSGGLPIRQVMVSSCLDGADRMPTFEIVLDPLNLQKMTMNIRMSSSMKELEVLHTIEVNEWSRLTLIYDGTKVLTEVDALEKPEVPVSRKISDFKGSLPISRSGLRFGVCLGAPDKQSFVGDIYQIKFGKCLSQEQKNRLYPIEK